MLKQFVGIIWRNTPWRLRKNFTRLSQNKFTASVAVIVTNENDEVLLLDHVLRPQSGWAIPGGFMNFEEQPADAIRREIIEETGLKLKKLEMFRVRTLGKHLEILFRAEADGTAEVKSFEINAVGWFKLNELPEKMTPIQKSIVSEMLRNSS